MIEDELRKLIKEKYKSYTNFAKACNMPRTTLSTILKNGVGNANIQNIITMCHVLDISTDALADGKIEKAVITVPSHTVTRKELELIALTRTLNKQGFKAVKEYVEMLSNNEKYKGEQND